jgi:hypothetical protein
MSEQRVSPQRRAEGKRLIAAVKQTGMEEAPVAVKDALRHWLTSNCEDIFSDLASAEVLVGQYREALKRAYPYVKDCLADTRPGPVRDIIAEDLAFIGPVLASLSETPPAAE